MVLGSQEDSNVRSGNMFQCCIQSHPILFPVVHLHGCTASLGTSSQRNQA